MYESDISIQIDEERGSLPVLDILQTLSAGSGVETEIEVLRSRTLAEEVVDSLALQVRIVAPRGVARSVVLSAIHVERWAPAGVYVLDAQPDGSFSITEQDTHASMGTAEIRAPAAVPGATFALNEAAAEHTRIVVTVSAFDNAVLALQSSIAVSRLNREAAIVTVRYESTDTQLVHQIPNALAVRYIANGRQVRKREARSTARFLESQIDTLSIQLRQAEEAITGFREFNQVVSIQAEANAQVTNMSALQAQRNVIEAERDALQTLVDAIEQEAALTGPSEPSPYTKLMSFPTIMRSASSSELLRSLNDQVTQRSLLLQRRLMEDPDVINLTNRIHEIEVQLRNTAITYLQGLENQVAGFDGMLEQFRADLERIPQVEVQLLRLQREVSVLEEVYTILRNRLQEARILEAVDDASIRVLDVAILPPEPFRPRAKLNLMIGFLLGSLLGVGIAFLREFMDETVHTAEDMEGCTGGAPVLGMIPTIPRPGLLNGRNGGASASPDGGTGDLGARLVASHDPHSPSSEAYRSLRTNLMFSNLDKPPRTILFTSPLPQEGKSTSVANLAITLVQQGINTLLIDADLRQGLLDGVFKVDRKPGLTCVLARTTSIADAIQEIDLPESGKLHFMASGARPPNPAEVLGSQRMKALLQALVERYDMVLIDSAPLAVVTDSAVLGATVDGVVLIARAGVTEKAAMTYAVDQLNNVNASILGAVLNDVDYRRDSRYYSRYGKYGYSSSYYYRDNGKEKRRKG